MVFVARKFSASQGASTSATTFSPQMSRSRVWFLASRWHLLYKYPLLPKPATLYFAAATAAAAERAYQPHAPFPTLTLAFCIEAQPNIEAC